MLSANEILNLIASVEADKNTDVISAGYEDERTAYFAINDFRDWLTSYIVHGKEV